HGYEISVALIWETLLEKIEGTYDERKLNQYQTLEYGTIYKNTITRIIVDKFRSNSGRRRTNAGIVLLFDREKIIRFESAYDTSVEINIQLESESSVCSVNNLRCVGTAIQVYHDKIQLYKTLDWKGINNNKNGQIYTLPLEPTLPTLPTQSIHDGKFFSQPSIKTHPLEPTLPTLPTLTPIQTRRNELKNICLGPTQPTPPTPDNNIILGAAVAATTAGRIYRIHPHSDI